MPQLNPRLKQKLNRIHKVKRQSFNIQRPPSFQKKKLQKTKVRKASPLRYQIIKIHHLKTRIKKRILNSNNPYRKAKRKRNLFVQSYHRRFIIRTRRRIVFFITRPFSPSFSLSEEASLYSKLRFRFKKARIKMMRKARFKQSHNFLPLSRRSFNYGKLHITHRRRNTFATYSQGDIKNPLKQKVLCKSSAGCFYRGPKKNTRYARETVLKTIGSFVGEERTSHLDVFLTSGCGRIYKHLLRAFQIDPVYFRYLYITKRRSHGFTRAKKPRRT